MFHLDVLRKAIVVLQTAIAMVFVVFGASTVRADDAADLAAAAQNPVADMISLPLQNNTYFGVGPGDDVVNVLNVQPVIPVRAGNWNLINRTIAPVIRVPNSIEGIPELPEGVDDNSGTFGLGDINHTIYFSPAEAGALIWGVGPSLTLPTATDDRLGSEKWSAGPAAVALRMQGPWVYGALARNLWSFAGNDARADVNQFLLQPFVNYNLDRGWYLVSSPVITADWNASASDRWTIPVGGGVGKITAIGSQPVNLSAHAYYNLEAPTFGADFALRLQIQFLFPR